MNKSILSLVGAVDSLIFLLESDRLARGKSGATTTRRLERLRRNLLEEGLRQIRVIGNARDTISDIAAQLPAHLSTPTAAREIDWVLRTLASDFELEVDPPPNPSSSSSGRPSVMDPEIFRLSDALNVLLRATASQNQDVTSAARPRRKKVNAMSRGSQAMRFPDGKLGRV